MLKPLDDTVVIETVVKRPLCLLVGLRFPGLAIWSSRSISGACASGGGVARLGTGSRELLGRGFDLRRRMGEGLAT